MNIIAGWMIPEMNCARKLGLVHLLVLPRRSSSIALGAVAEDLHQFVAGEHLLDVAVDLAGPVPLGDELLLRALGDEHGDDEDKGTVNSEISASSGEIQNIMTSTPIDREHR